MTDKLEWQGAVGNSWAAQWQRTDRSFSALTRALVAAIISSGDSRSIVDIGCGAGELSLQLAKAMPQAQCVGLDVSADLIAAAQSRASAVPHLRFTLADAANWQDPALSPDLYVSRHGVMFFDDPIAAFANLARVAQPNARMLFSCFRTASENAWAAEIGALLPPAAATAPAADPFAPGPFAFAQPDYVRRLLSQGGWTNIVFDPVDFDYIAGAGHDPVSDALDFFHHIGPAARTIKRLGGEARSAFLQQLRKVTEAHLRDGTVKFSAAAWIVRAQKSH